MLFYTGAINHNAIQQDPSKSLGGYISSSQVPNDVLGNIFGTIDYTTVTKKLKDIRVLAFLNTTGDVISNFRVYTNTPEGSFAKIKLGLILNEIDAKCNLPYFEQLPSQHSTPLYIQLNDAEGPDNAVELSNIPASEYVGIFLQREIIVENNSELNPDGSVKMKSCDDFFEELQLNPNGTQDAAGIDEVEIIIQILNQSDSYQYYWTYLDTDPFGTDLNLLDFLFNDSKFDINNSISIDFTQNANLKYIVFKESILNPIRNNWFNSNFNFGQIPDAIMREPIIIGNERYYLSRQPIVLDSINSNIIFEV